MDERPPQPTDAAAWKRIEGRRKMRLWAGVAVAAIAVAAVVLWLAFGRSPTSSAPAHYEPIPGSTTATGSPSAVPTAGADATGGASASATGSAAATQTPTSAPAACMVAYRRAGKLCVARPDGSGEVVVATSGDGVFALSPDARTLAYVDAKKRVLTLVDLATKKVAEVGPAALDRPVWPASSAWCVYTATGAQAGIRRVGRDGGGGKTLFAGTSPAVAADGATVAGIREDAAGSTVIVVLKGGVSSAIAVSGYVLDVALSADRMFFAVAADDLGEAEIRSADLSGKAGVVLRRGTQAGARASFQDLCVSADGTRLVYAEVGDDGYSRLFALDAADGGGAVPLSVRRDDYPLCWGCDGRVYFIEGNAWQGEATRLMAVRGDGTGRTVVVEGASR